MPLLSFDEPQPKLNPPVSCWREDMPENHEPQLVPPQLRWLSTRNDIYLEVPRFGTEIIWRGVLFSAVLMCVLDVGTLGFSLVLQAKSGSYAFGIMGLVSLVVFSSLAFLEFKIYFIAPRNQPIRLNRKRQKIYIYDYNRSRLPWLIRTTFMGLYGVDSPLPTAYLDDIAQRREGHDVLQDFLDIFNHRILTQFYRIWRKYSYPATFEPGGKDAISRSLLGLVGLGIPGTANHIATPTSRFLALLGVLRQPGKTQEGLQAVVSLLAPDTTVQVSPYCPRPVEVDRPLGFYGDDDFILDGNSPLGEEAMDVSSQLLIALATDNEQEARSWKPDSLLFQDFLIMLRVYLGWRFKARITLTVSPRFLGMPPLGDEPLWLGINGVLGAEGEAIPEDIPATFTTELGTYNGLQRTKQQTGSRSVTYKFN